ncbi:trimeric intracellular cation channel family protein [Arcanobacterium hippocoleae]|uniref:Membrane protein YeiH n=1 Tax=Arcanobacterium hippocoleae TaxID=149017 RepID=A0ABU1T2E0_9ACTO|nr:trimeric intracellular cation channel family protein [Arcanobacterium hippocoleae]MDR6939534.1 putative membrane protein YeiH [Arcanobacterium hippocoleae]
MDSETIFRIVDVTGVIANGLLGATLARKYGFDIVGFFILAMMAALGGGILRDVMLGIGFPVALTDPWYLGGVVFSATIAFFLPLDSRRWQTVMILGDLLCLGCWSATGASKGLSAGLGPIPAIFLGVVTAIGGGMIRDITLNKVPTVFGGAPLYATFSIFASAQMVFFQRQGHYTLGMALAIISVAVFGSLARKYKWILPTAYDITKVRLRRPRIIGAGSIAGISEKLHHTNSHSTPPANAKDGRRNLRKIKRQHDEQNTE